MISLLSCFFAIRVHVSEDRNHGPGNNTMLLRLIPVEHLMHLPIDSSTHSLAF